MKWHEKTLTFMKAGAKSRAPDHSRGDHTISDWVLVSYSYQSASKAPIWFRGNEDKATPAEMRQAPHAASGWMTYRNSGGRPCSQPPSGACSCGLERRNPSKDQRRRPPCRTAYIKEVPECGHTYGRTEAFGQAHVGYQRLWMRERHWYGLRRGVRI